MAILPMKHIEIIAMQKDAKKIVDLLQRHLTIEAARTRRLDKVYQAAMMDPHTGSELDIDTIKKMVDELIAAHGDYLPKFS